MSTNVNIMSCNTYRSLVIKTVDLYLNQAIETPTCRYHRIHMMVSLFTYLLTPEVQPLLTHEKFTTFRATLLQKIESLLTESTTMYIEWPTRRRFTLALVNVKNYLLDPTYVPVRCSTRLVARSVGLLDTVLRSSKPDAYTTVKAAKAEIKRLFAQVSAPVPEPVRPRIIKVKVLPRRSARLMARVSHQA